MFLALSLLASTSHGRKIDFIDGIASGFRTKSDYVWVNSFTDQGRKVRVGCQSMINSGEWLTSVDDGPIGVPYYIVKVNPQDCLRKKFKVTVPESGRPRLKIYKDQFVFGDFNDDNKVDEKDLSVVQEAVGIPRTDVRWANEFVSLLNPHEASYYDFNHDGVVDEKDVAKVRANLGKRGE